MNELSDEVRFLSSRARPLVAPFHMVAVCAPGRVELKSRLFKLFIMNLLMTMMCDRTNFLQLKSDAVECQAPVATAVVSRSFALPLLFTSGIVGSRRRLHVLVSWSCLRSFRWLRVGALCFIALLDYIGVCTTSLLP
jgi:hypothetical protein